MTTAAISRGILRWHRCLLSTAACLSLAAGAATAQTQFGVVHAFPSGGAISARARLIQATDGNIYGTAGNTVFRVIPAGGISLLHAFATVPTTLIQGSDGQLYTTTGDGVFRVSLDGTATVLHAFTTPAEGVGPTALVQASDGNFYGVLVDGGSSFNGTLFRMTPAGAFTVLHAFAGGADGSFPSTLALSTDGASMARRRLVAIPTPAPHSG